GGGGARARHAAPDRGVVRAREPGDRPGPLRGAQLGGLASPHDLVVAGVVVPAAGAAAGGGGKTPAVTAAQVRTIFTELLRQPQPSVAAIAEVVSTVLRRNEESRLYHWHQATGHFPPRRPRPAPKPRGLSPSRPSRTGEQRP